MLTEQVFQWHRMLYGVVHHTKPNVCNTDIGFVGKTPASPFLSFDCKVNGSSCVFPLLQACRVFLLCLSHEKRQRTWEYERLYRIEIVTESTNLRLGFRCPENCFLSSPLHIKELFISYKIQRLSSNLYCYKFPDNLLHVRDRKDHTDWIEYFTRTERNCRKNFDIVINFDKKGLLNVLNSFVSPLFFLCCCCHKRAFESTFHLLNTLVFWWSNYTYSKME